MLCASTALYHGLGKSWEDMANSFYNIKGEEEDVFFNVIRFSTFLDLADLINFSELYECFNSTLPGNIERDSLNV